MGRHRRRGKFRRVASAVTAVVAGSLLGGFLLTTPHTASRAPEAVSLLAPAHLPVPVVQGTVQAVTAPPHAVVTLVNVTVHDGESLWSIAASQCGSGVKWRRLQAFNHIRYPFILHSGQVLTLAC